MQGLGGTGAQQSKDCSFEAGTVAGAPLRVSWFLVIFFVYQLIDAMNNQSLPIWVRILIVTGNELILLLTVLCHEMGHGTMARRCGGQIAEVLLWPFGGICFTTRPQGRNSRQKLVDDLWIVGAGPATHFPMAGAWCVLLVALGAACSHVTLGPTWHYLIPFKSTAGPCFNPAVDHCFQTWAGYLTHNFLVQAIQINVMLFMFNVFFPMYPMDGAKLIVCSLQLYCESSARRAAKVLVYTSVPLALLFIGNSLVGLRSGGLSPGITAYMGIMCLMESYKIYQLMKDNRLYTHPLFELARSQTRDVTDDLGTSTQLNTQERDDPEVAARAPQVQFMELRPFTGAGHALGANQVQQQQPEAAKPVQVGSSGEKEASATGQQDGVPRAGLLERLERETAHRGKTVRELEEERLQQNRH